MTMMKNKVLLKSLLVTGLLASSVSVFALMMCYTFTTSTTNCSPSLGYCTVTEITWLADGEDIWVGGFREWNYAI